MNLFPKIKNFILKLCCSILVCNTILIQFISRNFWMICSLICPPPPKSRGKLHHERMRTVRYLPYRFEESVHDGQYDPPICGQKINSLMWSSANSLWALLVDRKQIFCVVQHVKRPCFVVIMVNSSFFIWENKMLIRAILIFRAVTNFSSRRGIVKSSRCYSCRLLLRRGGGGVWWRLRV